MNVSQHKIKCIHTKMESFHYLGSRILRINGDIMIFQNQDLPNIGTKEQMKKYVFMVLLYFLYIEE